MSWSSLMSYASLWIGLIASIMIYSTKGKWYPIMYVISVSVYIFTFGFVIDAFNLSKDGILILLIFSTIIMIGLGFHLSRKS